MGPVKRKALKDKAGLLPDKPGIYFFKDARGEVVYIGKARSLRDRVTSYFQPTDDPKVHNILAETRDVEFILTGSEREAAFLENNFIRQNQPKFNLRLKDDKNFPFLKVTVQEEYPGIYLCRRVESDGARYFGPFSPALQARQTIRLINKFFGLRACEEAVFRNRKRPCLEYDLKYCAAPCVGLAGPAEYRESVTNALFLLEGKTDQLARALKDKMEQAARSQEFEQAAHWRDTLLTIERLKDQPRLISVGREDKDIWGYSRAGRRAGFLVFLMRRGRVSESKEVVLEAGPGSSPEGLLAAALEGHYLRPADFPDEIVLPFSPHDADGLLRRLAALRGRKVRLIVPSRGKNKDLLDLTRRNAENMMSPEGREDEASEEVGLVLGLDSPPRRIEGFDVSNIGGTETVASSVVFQGGRPLKSGYKKYIIRTVEGPNDTASLKEAVGRRFADSPERGKNLPDLVLVDGGKGQFQAAREALDRAGLRNLPLVSLAKREEIVFTRPTGNGLRLERTSPALKLFQHIRDEAHRFAVSFHRRRRSKRSFESWLDGIPGLGPKKKAALRLRFPGLDDIRRAPRTEVEALVGRKAAAALWTNIGGQEADDGRRNRD
jgi:excinuclease ABC subunit C